MIVTLLFGFSFSTQSQNADKISPEILNNPWAAKWIHLPKSDLNAFGVYHFRKTVELSAVPEEYIVHISADNRYKLFLNGEYIANGPARGDNLNWRFETIDLAKYLKPGKNVLAAVVWNFGNQRPMAQHTAGTGLIVQGNSDKETHFNTNQSWKALLNTAYSPRPVNLRTYAYYVVGPGENINYNQYLNDWSSLDYNDTLWENAAEGSFGMPLKAHHQYGDISSRILVPRTIPMMEETEQRFTMIRRTSGAEVSDFFTQGGAPFTIPPNSSATILLDQGMLTNAYPILDFSGGKLSTIKITYAESLYDEENRKGNRDVIEGKDIFGAEDEITADGLKHSYETLWWRTFRYVQLDIQTFNETLTISDFKSRFTGYPFEEKASFRSSDPMTDQIWEVAWRTQRLCAGENYFDCPYYEQLQYLGDTRIQGLVSMYVSGDSTLYRNALLSGFDSRMPFGLTQSRFPSYSPQIIPPFSLVWIAMLHDYHMLYNDQKSIKQMLSGVISVLDWFKSKIDKTGMVAQPEYWNFVDWVENEPWQSGIPPGVTSSHSAVLNLQFVYGLHKGVELFRYFGYEKLAEEYEQLAKSVGISVLNHCFNSEKQLIADTPEKSSFSEHSTILGVLTDIIPLADQASAMEKMMAQTNLSPASYYFKFYKMEALRKTGKASLYMKELEPWKDMLANGLTTFMEEPEPSRSDCHAWSASPAYHFLSLVAGIRPSKAGFNAVIIEPSLGDLEWIEATMPHRDGMIELRLEQNHSKLNGQVTIPEGLSGEFIWKGKVQKLKPGENIIQLD